MAFIRTPNTILMLQVVCNECLHTQEAEILNGVVLEDGTVDGYCGSAANYCNACDSSNVTGLGVLERPATMSALHGEI